MLREVFSSLADAKVRLFLKPPKLFEDFFGLIKKKSPTIDINQQSEISTPYYIIYRENYITLQ